MLNGKKCKDYKLTDYFAKHWQLYLLGDSENYLLLFSKKVLTLLKNVI